MCILLNFYIFKYIFRIIQNLKPLKLKFNFNFIFRLAKNSVFIYIFLIYFIFMKEICFSFACFFFGHHLYIIWLIKFSTIICFSLFWGFYYLYTIDSYAFIIFIMENLFSILVFNKNHVLNYGK